MFLSVAVHGKEPRTTREGLVRLDMKFNAVELSKCMSHYDIVMDECRGRKVEQAGEMKIMQNKRLFSSLLGL